VTVVWVSISILARRAMCHPLETSRPGVFAIGDVRSGSVRRVAAAVGEGAEAAATLHTALAATANGRNVLVIA
jgi:thioredoxin reductase